MKVLVVDDVGYIRHVVSRLLQRLGHATIAADSARQALQFLRKDLSIDVVVTDLLMAEMDGFGLFSASQKISRMTDTGDSRSPAFILMTAMRPGQGTPERDLEKLQLAKQFGFVDVLTKPFDQKRLQEALDNVQLNANSTLESKQLLNLTDQLFESVRRIALHKNSDLNHAAEKRIARTLKELKDLSQLETDQLGLGHNQPESAVD